MTRNHHWISGFPDLFVAISRPLNSQPQPPIRVLSVGICCPVVLLVLLVLLVLAALLVLLVLLVLAVILPVLVVVLYCQYQTTLIHQ